MEDYYNINKKPKQEKMFGFCKNIKWYYHYEKILIQFLHTTKYDLTTALFVSSQEKWNHTFTKHLYNSFYIKLIYNSPKLEINQISTYPSIKLWCGYEMEYY